LAACSSKRDDSLLDRRASMVARQPRIIIVFGRLTLSSSRVDSFGRHLIHNRARRPACRPADDGLSWPDTSASVPFLMGSQGRRSGE